MSSLEFGKELFRSLPPADKKESVAVRGDLSKLNAFDDGFLSEIDARNCSTEAETGGDTALMTAVRGKLSDYQSKYIDKDLTARFSLQKDENEEGSIIAHTYVEHIEVSNCRAGSWATRWHIKPGKETDADVSGSAQFHLHYHENGSNVQMRAARDFQVQNAATAEEAVNTIVAKMEAKTMSYEDKVAKAIIKQISAREKELHEQLKEMSEQIDGNMKKLRRILPITKTRFKWDAAAQKQVKLLNERKTE